MGIFTMIRGRCPKCGDLTLWDGPFSDCRCYTPENTNSISTSPPLSNKVLEENKRTVANIKQRLRRRIDLLEDN